MTKKRFSEILSEYGFNDKQIQLLWDTKPSGVIVICEEKLRKTAEHIAPRKDTLVQS